MTCHSFLLTQPVLVVGPVRPVHGPSSPIDRDLSRDSEGWGGVRSPLTSHTNAYETGPDFSGRYGWRDLEALPPKGLGCLSGRVVDRVPTTGSLALTTLPVPLTCHDSTSRPWGRSVGPQVPVRSVKGRPGETYASVQWEDVEPKG